MYLFINKDCEKNINKEYNKNIISIYLRNINSSLKIKYKFSILSFLILVLVIYLINIEIYKSLIKKNFYEIKNKFNLTIVKNIKKRINIAIYAYGVKNGGRARSTSLFTL